MDFTALFDAKRADPPPAGPAAEGHHADIFVPLMSAAATWWRW